MDKVKYLKAKLAKLDAAQKKSRKNIKALKARWDEIELKASRAWTRLCDAEDRDNAIVSEYLEVSDLLKRHRANRKKNG